MKKTLTAAVLLVVVAGCAKLETSTAARARSQLDAMRPIYEHGVATFPGATETDRRIWRGTIDQLDELLSTAAATDKAAP